VSGLAFGLSLWVLVALWLALVGAIGDDVNGNAE